MALKVVYVDDEEVLCEMFKENLESAEFDIQIFSDPVRAIQAMNANPPDVALIDYRFPSITGDLIAQQLPKTISIALVTGDLMVKPAFQFDRIFHKPFSFDEVATYLRTKQPRSS